MPELLTCDRIVFHVSSPDIVGGIPPVEMAALSRATGMRIESFDVDDGSAIAVLAVTDPLDDIARFVGYCAIMAQRAPGHEYSILGVGGVGGEGNFDLTPFVRH